MLRTCGLCPDEDDFYYCDVWMLGCIYFGISYVLGLCQTISLHCSGPLFCVMILHFFWYMIFELSHIRLFSSQRGNSMLLVLVFLRIITMCPLIESLFSCIYVLSVQFHIPNHRFLHLLFDREKSPHFLKIIVSSTSPFYNLGWIHLLNSTHVFP